MTYLERLLYKNKQQHRAAHHYQRLQEVCPFQAQDVLTRLLNLSPTVPLCCLFYAGV